jgi:hypothetical protein
VDLNPILRRKLIISVFKEQGFSLNARKEASSEDWRYVFEGKKTD